MRDEERLGGLGKLLGLDDRVAQGGVAEGRTPGPVVQLDGAAEVSAADGALVCRWRAGSDRNWAACDAGTLCTIDSAPPLVVLGGVGQIAAGPHQTPDSRPARFSRGGDLDDFARRGFVSTLAPQGDGCPTSYLLDTTVIAHGYGGHLYGTGLHTGDKRALVEFMKVL